MTSFELRIASVSDIHLGHPKNRAEYIVNNLFQAFPNNVTTGQLDIILIAGDLFDRALMLTNDDVLKIDEFIIHLLRVCKKYDIMLIILEGTPSHDRHQPARIPFLNNATGINANVLYVDELSIKYIDKFNIHVLFVPDECRPTTDKILEDTYALLKEHQLTKVDYAFMHGSFDYQVPAVAKCPKHDSKAYLDIVDKLIFIGHEHTRSNHERIYAQGSFDRLTHGDEVPKGHYRATVRSREDYHIEFIVNHNARTFITIDVSDLDIDESMKKIESMVSKLNHFSFVRIKANKGHPILSSILLLEKEWNTFHWSKMEVDTETTLKEIETIDLTVYTPITITNSNIVDLFLTRVNKQDNLDLEIVTIAEKKLRELK